ncbi:unnamed protein product [Diamesa serratosioi]
MDEGGYYVNEVDGLRNDHPALPDYQNDDAASRDADADSFDDLPTSIIVTNIHSEVFVSEELKKEMEDLFRAFSESVTFHWLKSFRRLRVNYENAVSAANARIQLHQYKINKSTINCYFAQPVTPVSNKNLQPPAPTKQFLISPPCSPPAGWAQAEECEPIVNQELLAALANLTPGEVHELQPATESQPSIVVHTAQTGEESDEAAKLRVEIAPTRCPERV